MTIDKLHLQQAAQTIIQSLHLPGFSDNDVIRLGRMIYNNRTNEWLDNHELMRAGYNDEHYEQIEDVPNDSTNTGQW